MVFTLYDYKPSNQLYNLNTINQSIYIEDNISILNNNSYQIGWKNYWSLNCWN